MQSYTLPGDLAMIILTVAVRRPNKLLYPLPVAAGKDAEAIDNAIDSLRGLGLVAEVAVARDRERWPLSTPDMIGLKATCIGERVVADDLLLS